MLRVREVSAERLAQGLRLEVYSSRLVPHLDAGVLAPHVPLRGWPGTLGR